MGEIYVISSSGWIAFDVPGVVYGRFSLIPDGEIICDTGTRAPVGNGYVYRLALVVSPSLGPRWIREDALRKPAQPA